MGHDGTLLGCATMQSGGLEAVGSMYFQGKGTFFIARKTTVGVPNDILHPYSSVTKGKQTSASEPVGARQKEMKEEARQQALIFNV